MGHQAPRENKAPIPPKGGRPKDIFEIASRISYGAHTAHARKGLQR
jgi:hypothetical protein